MATQVSPLTASPRRGAVTAPRARALIAALITHAILLALAIATLLPFFWMLSTSLKPEGTEFTLPFRWLGKTIAWDNYAKIFQIPIIPMGRIFLNTIVTSMVIVVAQVVTGSMGAYAFARLRFPGREKLFLLYLATLMVPGQVTLIPNFLIMRYLGWINTYWALTIPGFTGAFGTFLLRQFFLTIPKELEDAAYIDGASRWGILWNVVIPLSGPALATLSLFSFLGAWSSFLWPLVVTNSADMRTLPVGIALFSGSYTTQWALLMAASMVSIVPILLVFVAAQRYFIRGISLTGFGGM